MDKDTTRGCATGTLIFICFVAMVFSAIFGVFGSLFSGTIIWGWGVIFIVATLVFLAAVGVIK